jgi:hypothetical protein
MRTRRVAWASSWSTARPSTAAIRRAVSASDSGSRPTTAVRSRGSRPQPRLRSASSGRVVATTSRGTPLASSTRWRTKASSASSAQCRSSSTSTSGRLAAIASRKRRQPRLQPLAVGRLLDRGGEGVGELGGHGRRAVELEDARLRLEHLPERPEADALPVGQAVALAPGDQLGLGVHERAELADQPALADPGLAGDGDQPHRGLVAGAGVGAPQPLQLGLPAQERRGRGLLDGDPEPGAGGDGQPHRQRPGLALDPDRGQRLVVEQPPGRPEGRLADQHAPDRGHPSSREAVLMPMRTSSASSCAASSMARPQRTARSGSSSWVDGAPNTAITPSPMNLSRVPPNRSISRRTRAW